MLICLSNSRLNHFRKPSRQILNLKNATKIQFRGTALVISSSVIPIKSKRMKTRTPILVIAASLWAAVFESSEVPAQTAAYLELFGQNSFFTVNYDRMLGQRFGLRAGMGMSGLDGADGVIVPITVNYLRGVDHKLELSAGFVYENGKWQRGTEEVFPILSAGYRYQPAAGGFMFRIGLDALWYLERVVGAVSSYDDNPGLEPGISLSFGYGF